MKARKISTMLAAVAAGAMALALAVPANAAPPDNTAPTVNVNNALAPIVGQQLSTGNPATVPVSLSWNQYDASGICSESEYIYDDSADYYVVETSGVETSLTFTATIGHYYEAYIYPTDCSPNANQGEGYNSFGAPSLSQEGSATYSPGWTTSNCGCFSGGTVLHSSKKNASASFQYSGYGVAWITEKASNRGTAVIYLDGVKKATVKLNNAAISSDVGAVRFGNTYGTHTLKIVVSSGRVDVDAFLVS